MHRLIPLIFIFFIVPTALAHSLSESKINAETLSEPSLIDIDEDSWDDNWSDEEESFSSWSISGFVEGGYGTRLQKNKAVNHDTSLAEFTARLNMNYQAKHWRLYTSNDLVIDELINRSTLNIRTANIHTNLNDSLSLKIGRQVNTWGTGDYLFLNDLFPKDWQSFFAGRDDEYLKKSSDSIKALWFKGNTSIEMVFTPKFTADRIINGERFSYFLPAANQFTGRSFPIKQNNASTLAIRVASNFKQLEYAFYGYLGYWNTPVGQSKQFAFYPKLNVYGASIRSPMATGLINAEFAYYQSADDKHGDNGFIANSQTRVLIGYELELLSHLTFSTQYYLEHTQDHAALLRTSSTSERKAITALNRQVATVRINYRMLRQKLTLGLFGFWSPTDEDSYLRPSVSYRVDDQWKIAAGANIFQGKRNNTFFGQHKTNSNVWLRVRYNY
ncbi:MAG: hypothetical protein ACPGUD_11275 [Parashewanella sp.]